MTGRVPQAGRDQAIATFKNAFDNILFSNLYHSVFHCFSLKRFEWHVS
jgi:hypothetical protein